MSTRDLESILVSPNATIREVLTLINKNSAGIVLVTDPEQRIIRSITDGDVRRAILAGTKLEDAVSNLPVPERPTTTAIKGTKRTDMLELMHCRGIQQLPIVDAEQRVVDLVLISDLIDESNDLPSHALVMAGGFGTRLAPLTKDVPKPMLPVGDKPVLEHILNRLQDSGIESVSIATHYKPEVITDHFGDGHAVGLNLNYVHENEPLGTAGALRMIEKPDGPLLVLNGDVLTSVDFRLMRSYHDEHEAVLTMAVRPFSMTVPYGVVQTDGHDVLGIEEKPSTTHFVNAGIYLLSPEALEYVHGDGRLDMTQLIDRLIAAKKRVVSFLLFEYWIDIGQMSDYDRAQTDVGNGVLVNGSLA